MLDVHRALPIPVGSTIAIERFGVVWFDVLEIMLTDIFPSSTNQKLIAPFSVRPTDRHQSKNNYFKLEPLKI
nr:hypothetical protein 9 [bacterium]